MCGISGIVSFEKKEQKEIEHAIERMDESQALRGPDDRGVFLFSNGGFGHRRLSIIDLSKDGHQPMIWQRAKSKSGHAEERQEEGKKISGQFAMGNSQLAITFNGEIYNFQEIKKELENLGVLFHTHSDTEVILAGYERWGIEIVKKLRGMFAFGLWDEQNQKLFLVRDRYGIKPLYYYFDREKIVFASTVKAIEKSDEISIEKNQDALIGFLLFGSVPLPYTTLKDVYAVPSGHYFEIDLSGGRRVVRYYDPLDFYVNKNPDADLAVISGKIRMLLEDAVERHLVSDAPLGVFLSGGLDSSVVSALAGNKLNRNVTTLSVYFEEEEFSEKKYQDIMVERIGSAHREILVTREGFYKILDGFWGSMDQPSVDGVNSFVISGSARQVGLKAVLSGLGSDEIFLGYANFKKAKLIRKIQLLPKVMKLPLLFFGSILGGRYRKLSYLRSESIFEFYLSFRGIFLPSEVAKILNISESQVWDFIKKLENELLITNYVPSGHLPQGDNILNTLHPADLLSYLDLTLYMQNQLLKDTDVMSMAHSVEVRVPFLDHPLVEYITSLPPELKFDSSLFRNSKFKIQNLRLKPLLSAAVVDLLPEEVFTRSKMGFTFPLQKWLSVPFILKTNRLTPNALFSHWSQNWAIEVLKKFS